MVVALCAAVAGLGAGPGFLYGFLGTQLKADLGLTGGSLGLLIGIFFGATGLASVLAARWGSRLGPRGCLVLNMGALGAAMATVAAWSTYPVLVGAAALGGVAYAFGNVGTTMAVVLAAPPSVVGLGLTARTAGVPLVAALLALGAGASGQTWHWLPWSLAGGSLVLGLAALVLLPSTRSVGGRRPDREGGLPTGFWWVTLAAFLFIAGSQPLQSWTVVYLHDAGDVPTATAGPLVAAGTLLGMAVMLLVARLGDRVGAARRGLLTAIVSVAAAVGVVLALSATAWWLPLGLAGIALGIGANLAGAGLSHTVAADRSPGAVGRGSGLMLSGYYAGALVSPWVFGLLVERTGDYLVPWSMCALLLLMAGAAFWRTQVLVPVGAPGSQDSPQDSPQAQQARGVGREARQQVAEVVDGGGP